MPYEVKTPELRAVIGLLRQAADALQKGRIDVQTAKTLIRVANAMIRYTKQRVNAAVTGASTKPAIDGLRTELAQLRTKLMKRAGVSEIQAALEIIHRAMMSE